MITAIDDKQQYAGFFSHETGNLNFLGENLFVADEKLMKPFLLRKLIVIL